MDLNKNKFIGSGYTYPIKLNESGRPDVETGVDILYSSLKMLLGWPKNRRFFLEKFGSSIDDILEEPNDNISRSLLKVFIKEAVQDYEERIIINNVTINKVGMGKSHIIITFFVRDSKTEETLIYPYYKEIN